jgi:hypothetical protein
MKKLLLIAALVAPTWLYSCMPKSVVPDPSVVIQETFDKLPVPEVREIPLGVPSVAPVLPSYKPKATNRVPHARPTGHPRPAGPLPRPRPPVPKAPVVESEAPLPPQQGVIEAPASLSCIFPFNMVPNCTPEQPPGHLP